jgi:glycosyltransferase involved in cell wall biosynthesis
MNMPLVSVVMPVYNCEKYLKDAIDSVLAQTYKNIELLIVNDGSTDSSKKIILSYKDPRIRFFENESNSGIVYTRNKGLDYASGEYVATLDSDDIALPERIEKQVDFLEKNRDYAMCGTFYDTIDSNGKFLKKIKFPTSNKDITTFLVLGNCFCNSTIMARTQLAKDLKYTPGYDIVEDYELWYRMSRRAKIANLPFCGTLYRVHANSISVAKMNDMFARVKKINNRILADLNLEFSAEELEVHSSLLNRNIAFFKDDIHFSELELWMGKFTGGFKNKAQYNHFLLIKLLAEKWIAIAVNTGRYGKLFKNDLIKQNRRAYISGLWKRIWIKLVPVKD